MDTEAALRERSGSNCELCVADRRLLEMRCPDEDEAWAAATGEGGAGDAEVPHLDTSGAVLRPGDLVTLNKDPNVKGDNFTARRGAAVRDISLVADNPGHIEGRVNGQQIVILTRFVKKSN